ncbi:CPBP family intramembrane glutamic endopeptidase [Robertmurraya korlensis]|uniref:CPBP family intramembrane glutamic endopeptidase n=1 Tax=Robertmurraya korlensis TaxID=519977 RepID=UPI000824E164|nr:type II CAAX endopeptidase family protein [Robertmurraya korlensis]
MTFILRRTNYVMAILFFVGIIVISSKIWIGAVAVLLLLFIFMKSSNYRFLAFTFICFLVSLIVYQIINIEIELNDVPREPMILLNRSLLVLMLVGLYISHRVSNQKIFFYFHLPRWRHLVELPFHSIKLSTLTLIVIGSTGAAFLPIVLHQEILINKTFIVFCILFSLINATLEELIWRGVLLFSLVKYVSVSYALVVTSIGFGLMHLFIGIPFILCLFFSLGGLFYGMIVLKTNSIFPSIIFHMVINIGMVFSGFIL